MEKKDVYQMDIAEVYQNLGTGPDGLDHAEAAKRIATSGYNELEEAQGVSPWQIALDQFKDPLIYILLAAAVVTALLGEFIDTYVILAVVTLNAVFGFIQEYKAEQAIRALAELTSPKSLVVRSGRTEEIESRELVPGDLVLLSAGSRIAADMHLVEAALMDTDESPLTGESTGVRKTTEPINENDVPVADRNNLAFMGTTVLAGRGTGIVYATGKDTQIGQISEKVKEIEKTLTPLQLQFIRLGKLIGILILSLSVLAFLIGVVQGLPVTEILLTAIALAVAAIPEGLPVVFTLTLAVGVNRMSKRNAIVRHLPSVETLGSCSVIASDKTGTLTQNQMTVRHLFAGGHMFSISGGGYKPEGEFRTEPQGQDINPQKQPAVYYSLLAGLLANESDLLEHNGEYDVAGDPTEAALLVSALKAGLSRKDMHSRYPRLAEIPFESDRFYMAVLTKTPEEKKNIVWVKGAPEKILEMCRVQLDSEGHEVPLQKDETLSAYRQLGEDGLRVLAMAYKTTESSVESLAPELVEEGLVFAGLQAMMDPPREEALEAIAKSQQAGVRIVMVTGDHPVTASSIAEMLGIHTGEAVVTGRDVDLLSDEELLEKVGHTSVFARVSPINKLRIVQQLIKRGEVVAVTGDGVNDAPALKAAHIGVAMGKTGTDVAKETADIVVTDDNFASIFAAVEEGRVVFANLRKATFFLLSTGTGVVLLILLVLGVGLPLPFRAAQILWLNLVTNGLQDVALAFEPKEEGILDVPPRNPKEPILSRLMISRLIFVGLIMMTGTLVTFLWQLQSAPLDQARTVALTTMVMFQMFHVFNARSDEASVFHTPVLSNPFLFFSVIASFLAHLTILYVPFMQTIFRTTPLTLTHWLVVIGTASSILIGEEAEKAVRRRRKKHGLQTAEK
ncbi:MAG: HAD-IC family P-type ATPase [Bacillota bacterium]|nr:HAD-IC family P-type ATPase [Bacillota bacterium]MDW7684533.1 HAD-IC family P-type ATPase [Bacillota bacterium]